jgi:hypothetical protein
MVFAGVVPDPAGVQVRVEIVLCHGGTIAVPVPDIIRYDEAVRLTR